MSGSRRNSSTTSRRGPEPRRLLTLARPPEHLLAKDPEDFTPEEREQFARWTAELYEQMAGAFHST